MDIEKVFEVAEPYLEKNDSQTAHTKRVLQIAKENFEIPSEIEELTLVAIIFHDIGGNSIKKQYERGPKIAESIMCQLGYDNEFIQKICDIIKTHHDHPENPSQAFKILYDSDKIVMFSQEEFFRYDSKPNFNWDNIIDSMYFEHSKVLARKLLQIRKKGGE